MEIFDKILKDSEYYHTVYKKTQIVLHHTVSNPEKSEGDINYWNNDKKHIGTAFIINSEGVIYRCFDEKYWDYHVGLKTREDIEKYSIGIELDNWGGLSKQGIVFKNAYGSIVKVEDGDLFDLGEKWRGYQYFKKYTDKQINSLRELLKDLCERFDIPVDYKESMWDVRNMDSCKF
jgi:N-acetyl-anhydromuramyl-L-alanine amidase AmpD